MFSFFCCRKKPQPITPAMIVRRPNLTRNELLAIKSLLEKKSNIQGVDPERKRNFFHSLIMSHLDDCSILVSAIFEPYRPVMKSLLEARDLWGSTPLHLAIGSTKNLEWMLKLYQSFNADCNILDNEGSTPVFDWIDKMYRYNDNDLIGVLNDHIKLLFKMQINCFRVTKQVKVDGVERNLTPLEYARFKELERPGEISQHMKVSTIIQECMDAANKEQKEQAKTNTVALRS